MYLLVHPSDRHVANPQQEQMVSPLSYFDLYVVLSKTLETHQQDASLFPPMSEMQKQSLLTS
jgi:hypothetical protein